MHKQDYYERLRRAVLPPIGRFLAERGEPHGLYAKLRTDPNEFAFIWGESEAELEHRLHHLGFVRNPLAAWKTLGSDDGPPEQGSWAWRGEPADWQRDPWADYQLHVQLFEVDGEAGTTVVCSHWEFSYLTHPWKHYRGHPTGDEYWGEAPEILRAMFRQHFGDYDELADRPPVADLLINA